MVRHLVLTLALLGLAPMAAASPWFDRAEAELLVSTEFPSYYEELARARNLDQDAYDKRLLKALQIAEQRGSAPELVAAWTARWDAQKAWREAVEQWQADPDGHTAARQEALFRAAENVQLRQLDLVEIQLSRTEQRAQELSRIFDELELNLDATVEERVAPLLGQ